MADTVYALSSSKGRAGVAVIRITGEAAAECIRTLFPRVRSLSPRMLCLGSLFCAGKLLDRGMYVFFPAPNSYTGEDMAEIHCHGNPLIVDAVFAELSSRISGCRMAEPGEFTKRAYLNGRMPLTDAEAVMDVISARSLRAAQGAVRAMTGETGVEISAAAEKLKDAVSGFEATVEYPGEDWEQEAERDAFTALSAVYEDIKAIRGRFMAGRLVSEGISVALVGKPNAGKSSILNAAAGFERAIVDEEAGTTRDVLEYSFSLDGMLIRLLDTAGRRNAALSAERKGLELGEKAAMGADAVIFVCDSDSIVSEDDISSALLCRNCGAPCIIALNKKDLHQDACPDASITAILPDAPVIPVSAKTGENIDALFCAVKAAAGNIDDGISASARQRDCLIRACDALERAVTGRDEGLPSDMISMDAMTALEALYELTGQCAREDVVDTIFSEFCVGK